MTDSLRYKVAIVGAAETTELGVLPNMSTTHIICISQPPLYKNRLWVMRLETIEKLQSKGFPLNRIQILYPFPVRSRLTAEKRFPWVC